MSHSTNYVNPLRSVGSFWRNRSLIWQMTRREVAGRYRGSILGLLWSFFNPVFMLLIYTFVFSVVFQAKWGQRQSESKAEFALILFAGLIVFNLFSEVLSRAPGLVLSNVNYVKKVVFPLEILPVVATCSALFHAFVSVFVLLAFRVLTNGFLPLTAVLFPLVLLPFVVFVLGLAWFLSSLGVFVRDVGQTIGILISALMFVSPIFFPASVLPEQIRAWLFLNPVTFIIEQARAVLLWNTQPDWQGLALYLLVGLAVAWCGFLWFQKTRKGFADVL